jgi:uncharacterized protein YjiS (DUF1127 family)
MIMTDDNRSFFDTSRIAALSTIIMSMATDIGFYAASLAERRRQRRALGKLDHRLLNDIGLSANDILDELHKPFWR